MMDRLSLISDLTNVIVIIIGLILTIISFVTAVEFIWQINHALWFIIVILNLLINRLRFRRFS